MKIRIRENSIRLRLTKSEVGKFCAEGFFERKTQFPNGTFTYALQATDSIKAIAASISNQKIVLLISKSLTKDWYTNEKIGFEHTQQLTNGSSLYLLIEKDFVCMDTSVEDQSDNYPNPSQERN